MTLPAPSLAVVVKGWPRLSETFIAQELVALEESGVDFEIWSLRHPTDIKRHPLHERLQARVRYLPEYLRDEPERVKTAMDATQSMPGYATAKAVFEADLARDDTPNRRRRWGQACVMAHEADAETLRGIYAHFLHTPSSVARYAAILLGVPWSFSAHAKDIWTSPEWELREKLSDTSHGASFGATCTAFGAEHLNGLASGTPVDLVYHGLDLSRFPAPVGRALRAPSDPFTMLSVGRLVEKKGFDQLIKALALLPETLDWRWVHIGGGPLLDAMQQQAQAAGVADRITWQGPCDQPEVITAMTTADLFVLPSRIAADGDRDGLPNVLMEAASQKLAILSTPVSAIPEFIDTETHGILSTDAPDALAREMQRIASDPRFASDLAEAAYQRLTRDFLMAPGIRHLAKRLRDMLDGDAP